MMTYPLRWPSSSGKGTRLVLAAVAALAMSGWTVAQTISDVPLAVKNNVPPNLMFMLDNSGSMSNIVPTAPYDPTAAYTSSCSNTLAPGNTVTIRIEAGTGVPQFRYGGSTTYRHTTVSGSNQRCFDNTAIYKAALLGDNAGVYSGNYLASEYTGHYLNWYFGNYDGPVTGWVDRKRVNSGVVETRLQIAKVSAKKVIATLPLNISGTSSPAVRVGLSSYNGADGGRLRSAIADLNAGKVASLNTEIDGLTATGNTPLSETLADIGRYLSTGHNGPVSAVGVSGVNIDDFLKQGRNSCLAGAPSCTAASSARPIQYWCQRSYSFLLTDGRPQQDQALSSNTYLQDYDGDCSGPNVGNCTGDFDQKIPPRAYEGQGSDYLDDVAKALFDVDLRPDLFPIDPVTGLPATDPVTGLPRAKKNNMLTYTIGFADQQAQADPLLINAAAQGGGKFLTADDGDSLTKAFQGALTDAFAKDAASSAVAVANAQITVNNIGYASSYNSGTWYGELEAFSLDSTTGLPAGAAQWSARDKLNLRSASSRKIASWTGSVGRPFDATNFGTAPGLTTLGLIEYLRGDRTGEPASFRTRQHLLGDIVNAEPVVVNYAGNIPVIFQGANDGMLHAFDGRISGTTGGDELWAYVPRLVHANVSALAAEPYTHKYFVDGTPVTAEITDAGPMTRILVGGLGKGGAGYYGLDISSYAAASEADVAAKVKWEFRPSNMGYSFGTPLIVRTSVGWRVVVSSGYGNGSPGVGGDGQGYVWVLDPATGNVLATISTNTGSAGAPSGLAHLGKQANVAPDSLVRYVYGGDLEGNVWRFDLNTFTATRIATATDGEGNFQPITSAPVVGPVPGTSAKLFVYVGTGRYLADEDVPGAAGENIWAKQAQTMYGFVDDTTNLSPASPNIRGSNVALCPSGDQVCRTTCPSGGGSGDLVCQTLTYVAARNSYTATAHPVDLSARKGWYVDLPVDQRLDDGRVIGMPALTTGGTLAFTANVPTNAVCDPGGTSWFFGINAGTGGGVAEKLGGDTYYDAGQFLAYALASRPVIVQTAKGKRALIRLSDKLIGNPPVNESTHSIDWRRVYWRPLK